MRISYKHRGVEGVLDVAKDESVADAAEREGIDVFGSCGGQGICGKCVRRVRDGTGKLMLKEDGSLYQEREGYAPYIQTCQALVIQDGASFDFDNKARY